MPRPMSPRTSSDHRTALRPPGEGPRRLRRRPRPPADGDLGPDVRLRRGDGRAHPAQGPGADGDVGVLVRACWATSSAATSSRWTPPTSPRAWRRPRTTSRAASCSAARPRCCRSSASSAATSPARPGRSTAGPAPCTDRSSPPACGRASSFRSRSSRRRPRPTTGHDENISFDQAADLVGEALAAKARDVSLELYRRGAEWPASGGSSSPTPSSSWGSSTATWCCATR